MLKFWKKAGHNVKNLQNTEKLPTYVSNNHVRSPPHNLDKEVKSATGNGPLSSFDDEGLFDIGEFESTRERSRLSKTLGDVLSDKAALNYFQQYMESRNASQYLHCWLDIESLKADISYSRDTLKTTLKGVSPVPSNRADHDSLSVSTDCDSLTADTNSLGDYSTATLSESNKVTASSLEDKPSTVSLCDSDSSPRCTKTPVDCDKKCVQQLVDEALTIFKKYVAQEAASSVRCCEEVRKEVIENVCDTGKVLDGSCFEKVQGFVYAVMEREYFEAFLGSDYFCKHQIDVLTSGNVALDDILYNETALFYFMEFLEQEGNRSLLEFWIAATNFQEQLRTQKDLFDPMEAQNDAVVLYDKYFSLQAHCPLGFSDKVRFAVEQSICSDNGLILECFHLPLKIVEQVLEKNYLKPFLGSQLFYKYLSDLIDTVQSNGFATSIERRAAPSDCSSERSFSTNSTFLAMEITHHPARKKENRTDMSIDTRELYDPDSLWKRKRHHRLSGGRVTLMGRYETDFEPEPDRKQFNLKKVMKKLVTTDDEDRKREEMAWQVAEMIVKDITSVTLNEDKNLHL